MESKHLVRSVVGSLKIADAQKLSCENRSRSRIVRNRRERRTASGDRGIGLATLDERQYPNLMGVCGVGFQRDRSGRGVCCGRETAELEMRNAAQEMSGPELRLFGRSCVDLCHDLGGIAVPDLIAQRVPARRSLLRIGRIRGFDILRHA
jgi:hypothetical protein